VHHNLALRLLQHPEQTFPADVAPLATFRAVSYARPMTTKPAKTPAVETIAAFARAGLSIRAIARRLQVHPSTVLRWQQSDNGAGNVPSRYHRRLLALAAETGAAVTERTLINGS
jgi:hypothetical protein